MVFATSFFTLTLLALPSFAVPAHRIRIKRAKEPFDERHLVLLRDDVSRTEVVSSLSSLSNITNQWDVINGFAGHFIPKDLEALMTHPGVLNIHENGVVRPTAENATAPPVTYLVQYVAFAYLSPGHVDSRAT